MTEGTEETVVERAEGLSDETLELLDAGRKATTEAVLRLVQTMDEAIRAAGERPTAREAILNAALQMAEQMADQLSVVHQVQRELLVRSVRRGADQALRKPVGLIDAAASRQEHDLQEQVPDIVVQIYNRLYPNATVGESAISGEQAELLLPRLAQVSRAFGEIWDLDLLEGWLATPNAHLNFDKPIDLIELGEIDQVISAIESAAWGVYA